MIYRYDGDMECIDKNPELLDRYPLLKFAVQQKHMAEYAIAKILDEIQAEMEES